MVCRAQRHPDAPVPAQFRSVSVSFSGFMNGVQSNIFQLKFFSDQMKELVETNTFHYGIPCLRSAPSASGAREPKYPILGHLWHTTTQAEPEACSAETDRFGKSCRFRVSQLSQDQPLWTRPASVGFP